MPSQPSWFHRLEEILGALRSVTSTRLDRAAVEKLFRVRQRRARQIMADLEGLRTGNAAAVSRAALIARLEPADQRTRHRRRAAWVPVGLPGLGRGANEYTPRGGRSRARPYGAQPDRGGLRPQ